MIHKLTIATRGGNMMQVASAGNGPVLLLVHGFPLDHTMWNAQLAGLSDRFHVLAPDMRGFGVSTNFDAYSIADLADDLEHVRYHFANQKQIVVCGLSMGGYVALEYWRRHGKNLAGLILADTKPQADDENVVAARLEMAQRVVEVGSWEATRGMLPRLLSTCRATGCDTVTADLARMLRRAQPKAVAAGQQAMADRAAFDAMLKDIQIPTQVICGTHDAICTPEHTREWACKIANAQLDIIENAGHMPPMETPSAFNQVVARFLTTDASY